MKIYTVLTPKDTTVTHIRNDEGTRFIAHTFQGEDIDVTDSYHTMHELYQHRMALNIALFRMMFKLDEQVRGPRAHTYPVILKSKLHHDGGMFEGYFVVVAKTTHGQISYHYDLKHWDEFNLPEVERVPFPFDGHSALDVMERLKKIMEH